MKIKLWVSIVSATLAEPCEHIMHSIKFEPTTPCQKSYKSKQLHYELKPFCTHLFLFKFFFTKMIQHVHP
jgi:hypothetical protein